MTQCTQSGFEFKAHYSREVVARFDGGTISSDGGSLLLRETDQRLNLLERFSQCFLDGREQDRIEHSALEMVSQRVYGLALGYEDLNDHEQLRKDPLFAILVGREELEKPLAGKSTLNRLELGTGIGTGTRRSRSGSRESTSCSSACSWSRRKRRRRKSSWM